MKTPTFLLALSIATLASVTYGQDAKNNSNLDGQAATKETDKASRVTPPKQPDAVLGKRVIVGGYLSDLAKAPKKRQLFNLKQPLDFQKDSENVSFYPRSEKVQGIILFSFKF